MSIYSWGQKKSSSKLEVCQSIAEYVVIISIVISAVLGMKVYLTRSVQARVKDLTDTLIDPTQVAEVNPIVPLLGTDPTGTIKKKSESTLDSNATRTENDSTIEFTKKTHLQSSSKYLVKDDPTKKINF